MPQTIRQSVDAIDDVIATRGAGARIEIQRDTTSAFAAPTNLTPKVLVAGQSQYEIYDPAGVTGNWYRTRLTTTTGTEPSDWVAFRAGAPVTYATIDALRELLQLPDDSRDNLLSDLLLRVTDKINLSLGFDFFRHPAVSGTEVRTYDGDNTGTLAEQQGFSSVSQVRWTSGTGGTWTAAVAADHLLSGPVAPGGPFLFLKVSDVGAIPYFYRGYGTVEVTGVFGYLAIPPAIEMATLYWAADLYRIGASGGIVGSGVGLEELGQPRFLGGMPRITWETVEDYRARHKTWLVV